LPGDAVLKVGHWEYTADFDPIDGGVPATAIAFAGEPYRRVVGAEDSETNIELTYAAQVTDWLSVQPNIQYIIDTGLDAALDDALVLGLRLQLHRVVSF